MDYGTGISKIMSCYKGLHVQSKFENVEVFADTEVV